MKASDICLVVGILTITVGSVFLVPPRFTGPAVLAHIIATSLLGSTLVVISGIVVGWFNQRWKSFAYAAVVAVTLSILVARFLQ